MTAFDRAWDFVKSPYYCDICGKEADDFVDLDGNMIICTDCYDPEEHVESAIDGIHDPYGFSDAEKDKMRDLR